MQSVTWDMFRVRNEDTNGACFYFYQYCGHQIQEGHLWLDMDIEMWPPCCRCLRDGELFEIIIQKMVDRWSGSIEAGETSLLCPLGIKTLSRWWGFVSTLCYQTFLYLYCMCYHYWCTHSLSLCSGVTAIRPEELEFPNTMTDIDYDTWMLR